MASTFLLSMIPAFPVTAAHLFAECVDIRSRRLRAFGYTIKEEVHRGLSHHDTAPDMARALVQSGWLPQFRVFNELQYASSTAEDNRYAWARRPPPQPAQRRRRAPAM